MSNNKFDEQLLEGFDTEFNLDEGKLKRFLSKAGIDEGAIKEQDLYKLGCGKFNGTEFIVNNAGALFFAVKPQEFVEHSYITCALYQGTGMASVIDRKDLEGDLLSLVDEAEAFVKRHTRLAYRFDGFKRIDIQEYPYDAIREAIINAVCHRDYSLGNNVFVNVFEDRVEIISPGSIPNDLSIKQVYGTSNPRNLRIVDLFKKAGYIEKLGSGLKRMDELMLVHGLKKPVYETNNAFFKVKFFGPGKNILELVRPSKELDLRELGLNKRQVDVLNHLQEKGSLTRKEIEEFLGTTKKTTTRDLSELIEKGFVKREGKSKKARYTLNS